MKTDTTATETATAPMPTNPEYVEMLREALEQCLKAIPHCEHGDTHRGGAIWTICDSCGKQWADDEGGFQPEPMPKAMQKAIAALSAPAPKQKLRPMSEAPRDGSKLLAYALDRSPVIVWVNRGEEAVWTHSDGTIAPNWLLGWFPLPEVEL